MSDAFIRNAFGKKDELQDVTKGRGARGGEKKSEKAKGDFKTPAHPRFDPAIVNDALDIRELAEHYGAVFIKAGNDIKSRCILPDHVEKTPSFAIYPKTNHFYCYGCGRGGDPLRLIEMFNGWTHRSNFPKVMREGAAIAGVTPEPDPERAKAAQQRIMERRREQERLIENERRAKEERAMARWLSARPIALNDLQTRYLKEMRGIDLAAFARLPGAVRVFDAFKWNCGEGEKADWREFPVICTALNRAGKITATHLTFLEPGKPSLAKYVGQKGRIVLGSPRGAAMHLARGFSGLPPKECFGRHGMADTLAICEGLEDALSVAKMKPEWRVWAAYSLDNIGFVDAPECAGDIVICGENDIKPAAQAALQRAVDRVHARAAGRSVRVAFPPQDYKDWNAVDEDLAREARGETVNA